MGAVPSAVAALDTHREVAAVARNGLGFLAFLADAVENEVVVPPVAMFSLVHLHRSTRCPKVQDRVGEGSTRTQVAVFRAKVAWVVHKLCERLVSSLY